MSPRRRWDVPERLGAYGELVMFSHSIFSFSFAALAFLVASGGRPSPRNALLAAAAFLGGRTCANALNRVVDRRFDAANPRTAARHIPAGRVSVGETLVIAAISFLVLSVCAVALGPLPTALLPLAGLLFVAYSYTKRFTWLCHVFLGIVCAGASVGAWIAARGRLDWPVFVLAAANAAWVAGFDIIYAIQDIAFDRGASLKSIPARFGAARSRIFASILHGGAVLLLVFFGVAAHLGAAFFVGVAAVAALMAGALRLVRTRYAESASYASYTSNQLVSLVLLVSALGDWLLFGPYRPWSALPPPFDPAGLGNAFGSLPGFFGVAGKAVVSFLTEARRW